MGKISRHQVGTGRYGTDALERGWGKDGDLGISAKRSRICLECIDRKRRGFVTEP